MCKRYSRGIATLVLCIFTWTSGGVFSVAHAARDTIKKGNNASQSQQKSEGAEESFSRLTDELTETLADPKSDIESKKKRLRERKDEIETLDTDIRKQFAETEKRLKAANLPPEILERHTRFVKHYDDNLAELKGNISRVEKAKDKGEAEADIEKTRQHLVKVKAPSRHQKLDPNNLPHRQPKVQKHEPRMKKEEFDKELKKDRHAWKSKKRIMVAANGSLAGMLTPEDLAETIEVQLTPEIRAKALELGNSPVKIYEWVRNNIDYQAYYGALKSAQQTLTEGAGNNFDQASLLIALLRAANIGAKYVHGTVEIPIEKAMEWVGGVTDAQMAVTILATQGIPIRPVISGGKIKSVQVEHVWITAWIDYIPSRGAVHKEGDTWISLDPSFKQYTSKSGKDMYSLMRFNAEQFLQSYIYDSREITSYQDFGSRLVDFVDENFPDASIEEVFGTSSIQSSKQIVKKEYPYLLGTLPYKRILTAGEFSEIPSSKRYSISVSIEGNSSTEETPGLKYSSWLSNISDKRLTISYEPATSSDEALVAQYGRVIIAVPPYLLNVRPVLKINGVTVASGAPIGLGSDHSIVIGFSGPDGDSDRIQNVITAGDYAAIVLQTQNTPSATVSKNMASLFVNVNNYTTPNKTLDDLLGQLLHSIGVSYFYHLSFENEVYAKTLQLEKRSYPVEAMITHGINVKYFFGLPRSASEGGVRIDVDRNINSVFSPDMDNDRIKAFMILSGLSSSAWENRILELFLDIPSVSTVQLLKLASKQGIPIYSVDSTNQGSLIPQLSIGSDIKNDIISALNLGKIVIVPKNTLTFGKWTGTGYIVLNQNTGAAGYMISGGLAGGGSSSPTSGSLRTPPPEQSAISMLVNRSFWGQRILFIARSLVGTPYIWGGSSIDPGFDCSGFVHEVNQLAGYELPVHTAANQYQQCETKKWLHSYDERSPGDIMWKSNLKHVGIAAGINEIEWPRGSSNIVNSETAVHASGRPCYRSTDEAPAGTPSRCVFAECVPISEEHPEWGGNPSCGKFNEVIESPLSVFSSGISAKVCRPY